MLKIGTCGYSRYDPGENWKEKYESKLAAYGDEFETVELDRTFYKLPQVKTAKRWMEEADTDFCMKAWQALTHETSSPTWRSRRDDLTEEQEEHFGSLEPHETVFEAWRQTKEIAEALDASVVLIQLPPSFGPTEDNIENVREFLSEIDRGDLEIAWEPRGDWLDERELVEELSRELELIHVTDLLREEPVHTAGTAYVRMHGLNEDRYDYDYDYTGEELEELGEKLAKLESENQEVYCMFNNYEKFKNAEALKQNLKKLS